MRILRIDHVGVIVNDLPAAQEFFLDLGLDVEGEAEMEGEWLDRIVGTRTVIPTFSNLQSAAKDSGIRHKCSLESEQGEVYYQFARLA